MPVYASDVATDGIANDAAIISTFKDTNNATFTYPYKATVK
jgi:hypothetical protein